MSSTALGQREHAPAVVLTAVALLAALGGGPAAGAAGWDPPSTMGLVATRPSQGGISEPYLSVPKPLCRVLPLSGRRDAETAGARAAYPKMSIAQTRTERAGPQGSTWMLLCPARPAASGEGTQH